MKGEQKKMHSILLYGKAKPGEISWDSPFGKGRPGWHIECSVMAYHELERQSIFMQEGQIYNSSP